ncbi:MAG: hypothetical protein AAGA91_18245 [Pseudomonadota bacterium]
MIIRGESLLGRWVASLAILFVVTACGGGGGGDGGFLGTSGNVGDDRIELTLLDAQGNSIDSITTSSPGTLRVRIRGGGNRSEVVVNVSATIGLVFPESGTALTNGDGIATFQIEAGDDRGAGSITATATLNDGTSANGTLSFQVGETGLRLGRFADDGTFIENEISITPAGTLAPGGNAQLSVVILNAAGERVTTVEDVRFSSGCISGNQATINPSNPVPSANGEAATLYTAAGCAGIDDITATLAGAVNQAFGTLNVAAPTTNSIDFVSAEPNLIVLRGTGGQNRDETADVIFRVVDGTGQPLSGVNVLFDLTTFVGGLELSKTSALTDGDGQVLVTVSSGDVATNVRVIATVNPGNNEISTVSDLLTVTTGLPDANSISLSVGPAFVINGGMTTDGLTRTLTVRMADKFNNPVVDGTAAVFTTEYGSVIGSCNTTGGTCSVEFSSQEPRFPTLTGQGFVTTIFDGANCTGEHDTTGPCPNDLGPIRGGRSAILVHAIGEESFIDANGNGIMDESERDLFANLPEAWIDNNEDGIYTPAIPPCDSDPTSTLDCLSGQEEIFVDFNGNDVYDFNDDPPVYNGLLCPPEGDGVWCSRRLLNVFAQTNIALADDTFFFVVVDDLDRRSVRFGLGETLQFGRSYTIYVSDQWNNPPEAGSAISLATEGDCELDVDSAFSVPNFADTGAVGIPLAVKAPNPIPDDPEQGSVTIGFSGPNGNPDSLRVPCQPIPVTPDPGPGGGLVPGPGP